MSTEIRLARLLRIGGGALSETGEVLTALGLERPLIVSDRYLLDTGVIDRLVSSLFSHGLNPSVFADTVPDPTTESLDPGVEAIRSNAADCVIGLGGGSPLDTAKALAVLSQSGGQMRDYKAPRVFDGPSLPIIAVPTTAGSGSEATRYTIITDSASNEKMLCVGPAFLPVAAIIDYELTLSMPARLTADTGVDALTHAIEAFVSRRANPFADGLALSAMRTIPQFLARAYTDPHDRAARSALMIAASQAGIAFSNSSVALVHGMSRPLGAHFHVAHGLSNAMLLPTVTAFSISGSLERYATCARQVGAASFDDGVDRAAHKLVDYLRELNRALDVPSPREYGLDQASWAKLSPTMAEQAIASGSPGNNPRVPSTEQIVELYATAWH
jgi:alcohol dehydrogenase class IV